MKSFHRSTYLRHVHYFVAAAEYGSFRQAATALNVRQSSVSRRIRDLEARIGKILFLRSARGVVLTGAGHHLLGPLKEALCRLEQTSQPSQDASERNSKPMTVGLSPFLTGTLLPQLVKAFRSGGRDIVLTFIDQADITRKSQSAPASIDIAITPYNLLDWQMLSPSFVMDHVAVIMKKEIDPA